MSEAPGLKTFVRRSRSDRGLLPTDQSAAVGAALAAARDDKKLPEVSGDAPRPDDRGSR